MTLALSKGKGGVQKRSLCFLAVTASAASTAPGTCPAPSGPAEALRFPHGQVNSERWTKLFGQPVGKKEKNNHSNCLVVSVRRVEKNVPNILDTRGPSTEALSPGKPAPVGMEKGLPDP